MKTHNFILTNLDTDSISFANIDGTDISETERAKLLAELNSYMPPGIKFEDDGYYSTFIVARAKNYYMVEAHTGKRKIKGSALKSSKMEKPCKDLQNKIFDAIVADNYSEDVLTKIYEDALRELQDVKDVKLWASRKTLTEKVLNSPRKQERDMREAVEGKGLSIGDKFWVYFTTDGRLRTVEDYASDIDVWRLVKKLYMCTNIFTTFLPCKWRINYSLKSNKKILYSNIWGQPVPPELLTKKDLKELEIMKYTEESIREIAAKCKTLVEFRKLNSSAYIAALRLGIVDSLGLSKSPRGRKRKGV